MSSTKAPEGGGRRRAKASKEPLDLTTVLRPVLHLPVRSLPFNAPWRDAARRRWVELLDMGMTQKDFAAWCGCAQGSVSNVLGEQQPEWGRTDYLERFSHALGIPLPPKARLAIVGEDADDADDPVLAKVLDLLESFRERKQKP